MLINNESVTQNSRHNQRKYGNVSLDMLFILKQFSGKKTQKGSVC